MHENLVQLEQGPKNGRKGTKDDDSDLEFNFSRFNLDDFDISVDDTDARVQLDPGVWGSASDKALLERLARPRQDHRPPPKFSDLFQTQSSPFPQQQNTGIDILAQLMKQAANQPPQIKMCTVEELERNMMSQHQKPKESKPSPEKVQMPPMNLAPPPGLGPLFPKQMPPQSHLMNQNRGFPMPPTGPGFNG